MATEIFGGAIIKGDLLISEEGDLTVDEVFEIHDGVRVVARPLDSKLAKDVKILTFGHMQKVQVAS